MSDHIIAVIPAYNEGSQIAQVVTRVFDEVDRVLVVDDCSSDNTARVAEDAGATVLRHLVNRGAGAATATGLRAALRLGARVVVTLDADGQHLAEEIPAVIAPVLKDEADFVIGSRMLDPTGMPWFRRAANRVANVVTLSLYGVKVTDSQSGFRAFSPKVIDGIRLGASGFEFCSEMVHEVFEAGFRLTEVPITAVYTDYSLSKGQGWSNGFKTLARLLVRRVS